MYFGQWCKTSKDKPLVVYISIIFFLKHVQYIPVWHVLINFYSLKLAPLGWV